jgi:hypothetical protein
MLAAGAAAIAAALGLHASSGVPARTRAEIRLQTLAGVAHRLYLEEAKGTIARHDAERIARDPKVIAALRSGSHGALRAAAFRELYLPYHVVRLAIHGNGIATDVGGPFVIAPERHTFTVAGRTASVDASVQDVAGFVKLIRRQTGLQSDVRDHHGNEYTNLPRPGLRLPTSGVVTIGRRARLVRSFTVTGWGHTQLLVRLIEPL